MSVKEPTGTRAELAKQSVGPFGMPAHVENPLAANMAPFHCVPSSPNARAHSHSKSPKIPKLTPHEGRSRTSSAAYELTMVMPLVGCHTHRASKAYHGNANGSHLAKGAGIRAGGDCCAIRHLRRVGPSGLGQGGSIEAGRPCGAAKGCRSRRRLSFVAGLHNRLPQRYGRPRSGFTPFHC